MNENLWKWATLVVAFLLVGGGGVLIGTKISQGDQSNNRNVENPPTGTQINASVRNPTATGSNPAATIATKQTPVTTAPKATQNDAPTVSKSVDLTGSWKEIGGTDTFSLSSNGSFSGRMKYGMPGGMWGGRLKDIAGKYFVEGNKIVIDLGSNDTMTWTYTFSNNGLVITYANGMVKNGGSMARFEKATSDSK